jgi:hypothetical protein
MVVVRTVVHITRSVMQCAMLRIIDILDLALAPRLRGTSLCLPDITTSPEIAVCLLGNRTKRYMSL